MASKRDRLIKSARQSVRSPQPRRILEEPVKKSYRVVAFSLYSPEADWVEQTVASLRSAGQHRANRSLVVREALLRLQEQLKDKDAAEIARDFTDHQYNRTLKKQS